MVTVDQMVMLVAKDLPDQLDLKVIKVKKGTEARKGMSVHRDQRARRGVLDMMVQLDQLDQLDLKESKVILDMMAKKVTKVKLARLAHKDLLVLKVT